MATLTIGSRKSRLALWQTHRVQTLLEREGHVVSVQTMDTFGDRNRDVPLPKLGEKGIFTAELDAALLENRIDVAVHSLKDLPTQLPDGLILAAVPERASPNDVLVGRDSLFDIPGKLPEEAVVATSSKRRAAQLLAWRPDCRLADVRGNVETRIQKMDENGWDGLILAEAGLVRLGLERHIAFRFPYSVMLPAVGQGALGVVTAKAGEAADLAADVLDDPDLRPRVDAERAFLRRLEGGCQAPIGALAIENSDGQLRLTGAVMTIDGSRVLRESIVFDPAEAEQAGSALAETLIGRGALDVLRTSREVDS